MRLSPDCASCPRQSEYDYPRRGKRVYRFTTSGSCMAKNPDRNRLDRKRFNDPQDRPSRLVPSLGLGCHHTFVDRRPTLSPTEPTPTEDDEPIRCSQKRFIVACPRALVTPFLWIGLFGLGSLAMAQGHLATVAGRVSLTDADGKSFPAVGVRLILNCRSEQFPRTEISDVEGAFRFEHVPVRGCTVVTDLQGFSSATAVIEAGEATRPHFRLNVEPLFAGVTVTRRVLADTGIKCHGSRGSTRSRRAVGSAEEKSGR